MDDQFGSSHKDPRTGKWIVRVRDAYCNPWAVEAETEDQAYNILRAVRYAYRAGAADKQEEIRRALGGKGTRPVTEDEIAKGAMQDIVKALARARAKDDHLRATMGASAPTGRHTLPDMTDKDPS